MRILVLGGTIFLGRHFVEAALRRGHEPTLFHRGRHGRDLFPGLARVEADRDGGLDALGPPRWDAVVDTCGYLPRVVRASAARFATTDARYLFVSTLSVHEDVSRPGLDEDAPVAALEDPDDETIDGATYGPLKAACETAVREACGDRALIVRPGLIVGPHDPTDRFTWWPWRVARGGEVLVPEHPEWVTQWIDVRDLASWMVALLEAGTSGTFAATGPARPLPFGALLQACEAVAGIRPTYAWAPADFLEARHVRPYLDLPLWVPDVPAHAGFSRFDVSRARAAGLATRPVAETIADTLAFARTRTADHAWRAGLPPEREGALLRDLRS